VASKAKPNVVSFGAYEFNPYSKELRKEGMRVRLEGQPLAILEILLNRQGELVTREELQEKLWPADRFVDFEHSLNAAVKRLRAALNDSADQPRYIETLARRGYRFVAPVGGFVASLESEKPVLVPGELARARVGVRGQVLWLLAATAVCVIGIAVWGWRQWRNRPVAPAVPAVRSLAVLPLENLSGDPSQEYFADGMTEELIGRLSMIHGLRVISRTSAMHFKNTQLSVPEIAKRLGVDAIVEGSIMREGSRIRVHAQLIRGTTDEHFWSQTYDRELGDALALESQVVQSIARRVEVTVTGQEQVRLTAVRTVAPEVYESYLKGVFALDKSKGRASLEEGIGHFEEAIRKDPTFAPAYVGLAAADSELSTVFIGGSPAEFRPKVESAARKALELDPELAEAHVLLANIEKDQWQWAEAEAEFRRAFDLNPNDAVAQNGFADWLLSQGRPEEALAWARRAREHDPLAVSGVKIGWILFQARRYEEAMHELRSVLAVLPDHKGALWFLGFALIANGQAEEAIPVLERVVSTSGHSPAAIGVLIRAYAHAGRRADALRALEELKRRQKTGYVPTAAFVNAYLGLDDKEQAFAWLERAYQEKSTILQLLKVHPFFDPIRGDPRFADLRRRVGLDQAR
jgi:TolB-like protein/DNA-binding winged helix-turn-helix (wHTH) protein/tetratricopeptide (TPR) repeat protein